MDPRWIDTLATIAPPLPDEPTRSERYIAVVWPYWNILKRDLALAVARYNERPGRRPVLIEDAGTRLLLRGDGHGLDVTFVVEGECLRARYMRFPWHGGRRPRVLRLRLDMRPDYLVLLDCGGCVIDDPVRFLLEPLFRALVTPNVARRRRVPTKRLSS